MWERGRVIAAISQGLAALLEVTVNGSPPVAGHEVTGTSREERLMAEQFIGAPYFPFCLELEVPARTGARFCKLNAFSENVIVSGQGATDRCPEPLPRCRTRARAGPSAGQRYCAT